MKVEAQQTVPVTVDIDDDEIYRITRDEIIRIYNLPKNEGWFEIHSGILFKMWMEPMGPYDPEKFSKEIRDATDGDVAAVAVLTKLQEDYKGWKYNNERY